MQVCNDINDLKLTDDVVKSIEGLVKDELVFILALDSSGNLTPMSPSSLDFTPKEPTSLSNKINTTAITSIENATIVGYEGSRCFNLVIGGKCYHICR